MDTEITQALEVYRLSKIELDYRILQTTLTADYHKRRLKLALAEKEALESERERRTESGEDT